MSDLPGWLQFVLKQMQLAERVLVGLWASVAAGCVAIFASALPYVYAEEVKIRCGSLGLTQAAIAVVPQCIFAVAILIVFFSVGRGFIATYRWRLARGLSIVGLILWVSAATSGAFTFAWFLTEVTILFANPPLLPSDLYDTNSCAGFVLKTRPYDPFKAWLLQSVIIPNQVQIH